MSGFEFRDISREEIWEDRENLNEIKKDISRDDGWFSSSTNDLSFKAVRASFGFDERVDFLH